MNLCILPPRRRTQAVTNAVDSAMLSDMHSSASKASPPDSTAADRIAPLHSRYNSQEAQLFYGAEPILRLEERVRTFQHNTFSSTSEQFSAAQLVVFKRAEEITAENQDSLAFQPHSHWRCGRRGVPPEFPRKEISGLSAAAKAGLQDATALEPTGGKTSEQLEAIPANVQILRHSPAKNAFPSFQQRVATAAELHSKSNTAGSEHGLALSKKALSHHTPAPTSTESQNAPKGHLIEPYAYLRHILRDLSAGEISDDIHASLYHALR